jgi:hypothetical protein
VGSRIPFESALRAFRSARQQIQANPEVFSEVTSAMSLGMLWEVLGVIVDEEE